MKKVNEDFYKTRRFHIICAYNDRQDIRCGGPATLGYLFYVDADIDSLIVEKTIKNALKESGQPCLSITNGNGWDLKKSEVWTLKEIKRYILSDKVV